MRCVPTAILDFRIGRSTQRFYGFNDELVVDAVRIAVSEASLPNEFEVFNLHSGF
jgi:hypothetical protein